MGLGLIGNALAGFVAGAGAGGAKAAEGWSEELHKKATIEAEAQRQENLARINNEAAQQRVNTTEAGANTRLGISEAGAATRTRETIQSHIDLAKIDREFRLELTNKTEKSAMERLQAQIGSNERIHRESNAVQRELHGPAADLGREQLNSLKAVSMLRSSMSNAVAEGDTKSADLLGKRIEALTYVGDKSDTAGLISIAGTAGKLAASMDATPEDKAVYGSIMRVALNKALGNKDATTPAAGAQWDDKTGDVLVGGVKVGNAKTKEEAMRVARQPPKTSAAEPSKPGLTGSRQSGSHEQTAPADVKSLNKKIADLARKRENNEYTQPNALANAVAEEKRLIAQRDELLGVRTGGFDPNQEQPTRTSLTGG